ncbi:mg2+ transporter-C MgtC family [Firmicutes bacterium CAG:449]|nr:mg2+ transporter-C MgtC family [Firmicutes bacterium CAG:449]
MFYYNDAINNLIHDDLLSICLKIFLAIIFGSIIGFERSNKRHSAGLRTFMLVILTSCVAMILDEIIMENTSLPLPILSSATIIGAIMLSGNSILFSSKKQIKGLTTSAALWFCSLLGLVIGKGLYIFACVLFVILLLILSILPKAEIFLKNRSNHFEIHLELTNKTSLQNFVTTIRKLGLIIDDIELNSAYIGSGLSVYTIAISIIDRKKYKNYQEIIKALSSLDYVYYIEELR